MLGLDLLFGGIFVRICVDVQVSGNLLQEVNKKVASPLGFDEYAGELAFYRFPDGLDRLGTTAEHQNNDWQIIRCQRLVPSVIRFEMRFSFLFISFNFSKSCAHSLAGLYSF